MQAVIKEEEKRRVDTKESDISTTRPRYETSKDFMHHTARVAVVLLGGRSLTQTDVIEAPH